MAKRILEAHETGKYLSQDDNLQKIYERAPAVSPEQPQINKSPRR
jgi:hypothetical protein